MIKLLVPMIPELLNSRNRIDVNKLRVQMKERHHIALSPYKAYNLKGILETKYPEETGK